MSTSQAAIAISRALLGSGRANSERLWADVLATMPLFAGVSKRHLRKIASLTKELRFEPQTTIVRQGERGNGFYVLLEGSASILRPGGLPPIALGVGDSFGEIALIDGAERTASVVAETNVHCLRLGTAPFMKMLRSEPEIAIAMLKRLAGWIRELQPPDPRRGGA
jgi:CRP-like cAMP-binding protein